MKNKKKILIIVGVLLLISLVTAYTYSFFTYNKTSTNSKLVVGDIYMHYNEDSEGINLENPLYNSTQHFEFSITGKNTHTKNSILYNIGLVKGDVPSGKTEVNRIQDKFLKFRLVEVKNGEEVVLKDNLTIEDINGNSIYSNYISNNTNTEISHTYRLFAWFDNNIVVGNTERSDYSFDEWNNLFASIKVNVNGAYTEAENFVEKVKARYNVDTKQDGLVAVNTSGNLAANGDTIREYRYSGIGNYCTYTDGTNDYNLSISGTTCPTSACLMSGAVINGDSDAFVLEGGTCADGGGTTLSLKNGQTTPTDSGLRNYVTFNNEMWRIVGIFNEENASGVVEERIKLVKDEPISLETEVETTITKNGVTYNTFASTTGTKYKYFYWNYPDANYTGNKNDWTKAGSQYYLNETYYNNLSNNNLIEEMKYYLGNVTTDSSGFLSETNAEVYTQERGSVVCDSSVTEFSQNSSCNIWYGNQATWNGKIALLYPSDFGYASDVANWSNDYQTGYSNGLSLTNWMFNNEMFGTWFLSPSSLDPDHASVVLYGGNLGGFGASNGAALRPVLSLNSQTMIISGTGSYEDPYQLIG